MLICPNLPADLQALSLISYAMSVHPIFLISCGDSAIALYVTCLDSEM
jgi:hypothetical protein